MWADCERPQKAKPVCAWSLFTVTGAKGWIRAVRVLAISRRAASGPSGPFAPCSPLPRSAASRDQTVSGFSGWLARISCCLASQADFRLIRNRSEFNGVKTGVRIVPARTSCYRFRSESDLFLFRVLPRSFMQAMNGVVSGFGGSGLLAFSPCQRRSSDAWREGRRLSEPVGTLSVGASSHARSRRGTGSSPCATGGAGLRASPASTRS